MNGEKRRHRLTLRKSMSERTCHAAAFLTLATLSAYITDERREEKTPPHLEKIRERTDLPCGSIPELGNLVGLQPALAPEHMNDEPEGDLLPLERLDLLPLEPLHRLPDPSILLSNRVPPSPWPWAGPRRSQGTRGSAAGRRARCGRGGAAAVCRPRRRGRPGRATRRWGQRHRARRTDGSAAAKGWIWCEGMEGGGERSAVRVVSASGSRWRTGGLACTCV